MCDLLLEGGFKCLYLGLSILINSRMGLNRVTNSRVLAAKQSSESGQDKSINSFQYPLIIPNHNHNNHNNQRNRTDAQRNNLSFLLLHLLPLMIIHTTLCMSASQRFLRDVGISSSHFEVV